MAIARDLDRNQPHEIFARYLVGCDGAHSEIRRRIGSRLSGDAAVAQAQSTYILAPKLLGMMRRPAWAVDCINPRSCGLMFAIDGRERWLIHNFLGPGESLSTVDRNRSVREILGVGTAFEFEVLGQTDWTGRRMVAHRFRDRRVFLCGDAAHIWVPFAGYGMNAGIADAMNLSWMLAGVIKGWADSALLDAYEIERQPITGQVSRHAMNTSLARASQRSEIPNNIEEPGPEGDALRARIGRQAVEIMVGPFCCGGLNFGYFYSDSPIIAYDGEAAPAYTMDDFSQSTVPGCNASSGIIASGSTPPTTKIAGQPKTDTIWLASNPPIVKPTGTPADIRITSHRGGCARCQQGSRPASGYSHLPISTVACYVSIVGGLLMAIFNRLFGRSTTAPAPPKMTKVEFAGSFMLIQFYDGHHWQMSDEALERYADSAGLELRELMRFWTLMYLAYLFRWCIFGVYGTEFEKAMMTSFYDRMKLVPVKPGEFDIAATIKYWFGHLDLAATAAAEKRTVGEHKDLEFPATYYAALRFIVFDPGSPWYMREDAPGDVMDKVIFGLSKVHDAMLPIIQNFAQRIEVP